MQGDPTQREGWPKEQRISIQNHGTFRKRQKNLESEKSGVRNVIESSILIWARRVAHRQCHWIYWIWAIYDIWSAAATVMIVLATRRERKLRLMICWATMNSRRDLAVERLGWSSAEQGMAFGRSIIENLRRRLKTVRAADLVIKFLVGLKGRTDYRRMTKRG